MPPDGRRIGEAGGRRRVALHGAVLLFRDDSPEVAAKFARADPCAVNGAVKRWYVTEWTTVAGEGAATPIRPTTVGAGVATDHVIEPFRNGLWSLFAMDYEWRVNASNAGALASTLAANGTVQSFSNPRHAPDGHRAFPGRGAVAPERLHTRVRLDCGSLRHGDYKDRTTCGASAPQRAGPRSLRVWGPRTSVRICPPTQLKCPKASHLRLWS
jgi:hypothetical protein